MGKKQTPAETLRKAREKGAARDTGIADGKRSFKKLEPGTQRNYQKQLDLWHEFANQNLDASPYDLHWLQKYVREMAYAIDGVEGIQAACVETVRKNWNAFTAAWRRADPDGLEIPRDIARSVTNFIKGPLAEEVGLTTSKRPRRFATKTHLLHFARQLWMTDWFEYKSPSTRVDDWLLHLANTFSSSRIGEYIESSCRPGTGRGLYYRDITFGVFTNEYGNPEFAIQLTRDAKNMTNTPEKRPQHALYEGAVPMMLCFNPMLPFLARLLVHRAFRDYNTIEELLSITPPEDEMLQLFWKDDLLDAPFFKVQSAKMSEDRIETANAFSKRHRAWGLRAGYPRPPTGHDFRAEGLYWVDKFYSEATRMVHAGHTDSNTLRRHYMPTNGADGQNTYMGGKGRTIVADLFRGLTVSRNPNLSQCLPAEKQFELESTREYVALNDEIADLEGKTDGHSIKRRQQLYRTRRTLANTALGNWQKQQPNKAGEPPGYHRAIFSRVGFMMPERHSLSQNLFTINTLRSPVGLSALHAMMALYQQVTEVVYRPGLEPTKCSCAAPNDVQSESNRQALYDWRHIYMCYKRSLDNINNFAELCFLCNEWVLNEAAWEDHCSMHIMSIHELPVFCDPLVHGGVLATPGYCPFCLGNVKLLASARLKQFITRSKWLEHVYKHVTSLNMDRALPCPHPQHWSTTIFETSQHLQFHLQDAHGIPFIRERSGLKRKRDASEDCKAGKKVAMDLSTDEEIADLEYEFINSTVGEARDCGRCCANIPSDGSQQSQSRDAEVYRDGTSTQSPLRGNSLIDPAILTTMDNPHDTGADSIEKSHTACSLRVVKTASISTHHSATESTVDPVHATAIVIGEEESGRRYDTKEDQDGSNKPSLAIAQDLNHERPPPVDSDDGQFEVEILIQKRRIGKGIQYLVKWRGYPHSENSWVKKKDIHPSMVAAFELKLRKG